MNSFKKTKVDDLISQNPTPIVKLIPNVITLSALFLSMTAIRLGINGMWTTAVAFIVIACVLDGIDGRVARLLNVSSSMGAQLDSLADFLNFGVIPPILVYYWKGNELEIRGFSWGITMLFAACMMIRLARFNVSLETEDQKSPLVKYFFCGVPAPVGAGLAILPMILSFEFGEDYFFTSPLYITVYLSIIALLLVSTMPTISLKKVKIKKQYINLSLALFSIIIIGLVLEPWLVLAFLGLLYILILPVGVVVYFKIKTSLNQKRE